MAKKPHFLDINISGTSGNYTATVSNAHLKVKPGKDLKWVVREPAGFPGDAVVFLQFYELTDGQKVYASGCLVDGAANNGKQQGNKGSANDHRVTGRIGLAAQGSFLYEIRYSDSTGDHMLLDPEIIVEGNPNPPAPTGDKPPKGSAPGKRKVGAKKRGKATGKNAAKKKAGKKKAGKKKAAKKGKGKKAKKTAKRRASKRR